MNPQSLQSLIEKLREASWPERKPGMGSMSAVYLDDAIPILRAHVEQEAVTLEVCAEALFKEYYPNGYVNEGEIIMYSGTGDSHKNNLRRNAKAVLDAAKVPYVCD